MCSYTGLIKRILPFALTFAVGLFIASFFVSIAFPGERWRSGRPRGNRWQEMQQLQMENQELRDRLRSMRMELNELRRSSTDLDQEFVVPPDVVIPSTDLEAHHPPPPPRKPKQPRVIE